MKLSFCFRSLASVYSFIDQERIGVWGWSYGGFVSTMMLIQDDQRTLSCGAAVAPVTSWLYYGNFILKSYNIHKKPNTPNTLCVTWRRFHPRLGQALIVHACNLNIRHNYYIRKRGSID